MSKAIVLLPKEFGDDVVQEIQVASNYEDKQLDTTNIAYDQLFAQLGSWYAWIEHIAKGRDYLSQQPIYNKFYCVTEYLGRANADIIKKALEESKDCQYFDGKEFYSIVGVYQVSDDWISGWKLNYI